MRFCAWTPCDSCSWTLRVYLHPCFQLFLYYVFHMDTHLYWYISFSPLTQLHCVLGKALWRLCVWPCFQVIWVYNRDPRRNWLKVIEWSGSGLALYQLLYSDLLSLCLCDEIAHLWLEVNEFWVSWLVRWFSQVGFYLGYGSRWFWCSIYLSVVCEFSLV